MILPLRVLGSVAVKRMSSGTASAPISLRTCCLSSSRRRLAGCAGLENDEDGDGVAFEFVRAADGGGFGDGGMADQRTFDFDRAQAVAGDVQHVVDAAHDPVVAVGVAAGVVAGQVHVGHFGPVLFAGIASSSPQMPRSMPGQGFLITSQPPWPGEDSFARAGRRWPGIMPGSGLVQEPGLVGMAPGSGLIMMPPVSVCHQVSTIGQRSRPILR